MGLFLSRKAPAKLNLGLHVLRRRSDGYHDLETVFVRIGWTDEVSVTDADALSFECDDPDLAAESDNLCLKAARALRSETRAAARGARIVLRKRIPTGAGLGGGSSDAAATLSLLNRLWNLEMAEDALRALGSRIGSDVPVFLHQTPAYATGRGEELSVLIDSVTARPLEIPFHVTVLKPAVRVSTAEAYRSVQPNELGRPHLNEVVRSLDLARWRAELVNDFEAPMTKRYPEIAAALELLREEGAGYAAMSGSGSAVFGIFESERGATAAEQRAIERGLDAWSGRTYQPIRPF